MSNIFLSRENISDLLEGVTINVGDEIEETHTITPPQNIQHENIQFDP